MVGVAGKSRGCNTCRKRKIACDQQRPVCAKCTRSNRVCGGYQKDTVFVLVQPAAEKTHIFLRPPTSPRDITEHKELKSTISSPASVDRSDESPHSFSETSFAYAILHKRMECQNLIQAFLLNCFPFHWPPNSQSWISLLGELPTKNQALEMSGAAVAASAIGHKLHDHALVKQSLKYYTQGLRQLQNALWDPSLMREDGTLAACMALSLYEALECPNPGSEGYFNHCRGLIALIQSRGHEAHSSGAGHRLFLGVRVPGILFSLVNHTSTILSESAWVERPWAGVPKTSHDQVVDCLVQAPVILQRVRSLPHLSISLQVDLLHRLIGQCWQIDNQLDLIYDKMRQSPLDVLHWRVQSRADSLVISGYWENLFPVVLCFRDAQVAATLILLWATRTMLWSGLSNMYQHLKSITPLENSSCLAFGHVSDQGSVSEMMGTFNPIDRCGEYLSVAHLVCQSVEYFVKDDMLLAGPLSVSPALGIVADSLGNRPGHGREIAWIQAALEVVGRKGLRVLQDVNT